MFNNIASKRVFSIIQHQNGGYFQMYVFPQDLRLGNLLEPLSSRLLNAYGGMDEVPCKSRSGHFSANQQSEYL